MKHLLTVLRNEEEKLLENLRYKLWDKVKLWVSHQNIQKVNPKIAPKGFIY